MENVAEALKMAAGVLVFVVALTISINSFGQARRTAEFIVNNQDRQYDQIYVQRETSTERKVGCETIIPTIYKSYKENYKIVFEFKDQNLKNDGLYKRNNVPIYTLDLANDEENVVLGGNKQKEKFIELLLYGGDPNELNLIDIELKSDGIYDIIKGMEFKESIGIYVPDELKGESSTSNVNKEEKRVITYTQQ